MSRSTWTSTPMSMLASTSTSTVHVDVDVQVDIDRAVHNGRSAQYRSNREKYRIDRIENHQIFKRPKNREDGLDFHNFWTESIVSMRSIFSKIFGRSKNYRIDRINRSDRWIDRSIGSIDGRHVLRIEVSGKRKAYPQNDLCF